MLGCDMRVYIFELGGRDGIIVLAVREGSRLWAAVEGSRSVSCEDELGSLLGCEVRDNIAEE